MLSKLFAKRIKTQNPSRLQGLFPESNFSDNISFGGGCPDESLFPSQALQAAYQKAVDQEQAHSFQYHDVKGPGNLRDYLANRARQQGIKANADDILLTAGGQQGIDLVAKLFLGAGDEMAVEAPSYVGALAAFDNYEPVYHEIPLEDDGVNLDYFEEVLKAHPAIKLFYTVPDFHNPTGITMSLAKRQRLVDLANRYDFVILEDTPYRDLRYHGESLPSIKSFDTEGRVIFLSSFSKILSPAFRLGWLVAGPEIKEQLVNLKLSADLEVPYLAAGTVAAYLADNDLDQHIDQLKQVYRVKLDAMAKALKTYLPADAKISQPEGGFFFWVELDDEIDTRQLLLNEAVPKEHLIYVPSASFYPNWDKNNGLRVNFTGSSLSQINEGAERLGRILSPAQLKMAI